MSLESHQNVDETGFQRNGTSTTTWIKTNLRLAVLSVGKSRRRSAFKTFVGWRYDGMVTSDRYAVYDAVAPEKRQLCWAHILRVFKALVDEGDQVAVVGSKLLQAGRLVIRAFNRWRDQRIRRGRFDRVVGICRRTIENLLSRNMELPGLRTLAHAFILTSSSVWLFTTDVGVSLGIEPTNNLAERDLRRFVLWKKRSFFSQSRRGDRFMERAMTIVCSCRKQGRDLHEFVVKAVVARKSGLQKPSLIRAV
jgi:transposase